MTMVLQTSWESSAIIIEKPELENLNKRECVFIKLQDWLLNLIEERYQTPLLFAMLEDYKVKILNKEVKRLIQTDQL